MKLLLIFVAICSLGSTSAQMNITLDKETGVLEIEHDFIKAQFKKSSLTSVTLANSACNLQVEKKCFWFNLANMNLDPWTGKGLESEFSDDTLKIWLNGQEPKLEILDQNYGIRNLAASEPDGQTQALLNKLSLEVSGSQNGVKLTFPFMSSRFELEWTNTDFGGFNIESYGARSYMVTAAIANSDNATGAVSFWELLKTSPDYMEDNVGFTCQRIGKKKLDISGVDANGEPFFVVLKKGKVLDDPRNLVRDQ